MTRGTPMTMETSKPPLCPLGNDEVWHQKYKAVNSGSQTILQFLRHPIQTDTHRYDMIITITTVYYLYTYIYIYLSLSVSLRQLSPLKLPSIARKRFVFGQSPIILPMTWNSSSGFWKFNSIITVYVFSFSLCFRLSHQLPLVQNHSVWWKII